MISDLRFEISDSQRIANPYLRAWAEYQRAERGVSWTEALELHFQRGAVVSTAELFVMARIVSRGWEDDMHLDLANYGRPGAYDCWHVWCVAGDLRALAALARQHGVRWVSYQRHGQARVKRVEIARLFNSGG